MSRQDANTTTMGDASYLPDYASYNWTGALRGLKIHFGDRLPI